MKKTLFTSALNKLKEYFLMNFHEDSASASFGWGQFLGSSITNSQIGQYGGSAGLIVLSSYGNEKGNEYQKTVKYLMKYFKDRNNENEREKLGQNCRIAFLLLSLSFSSDLSDSTKNYIEMIVRELQDRQNENGLWGDYYCNSTHKDSSDKLLSSSLILLSLIIGKQIHNFDKNRIQEALLNYISDLNRYSTLVKVIYISALTASGCKNKDFRKYVNNFIIKQSPSLNDKGMYFIEYKSKCENDNILFEYDYFIGPTLILLSIGGLFKEATPIYKSYSYYNSQVLAEQISRSKYFVTDDTDKCSSVDQAWVAILLNLANCYVHRPLKNFIYKICYYFSKDIKSIIRNSILILLILIPLFTNNEEIVTNILGLDIYMKYIIGIFIIVYAILGGNLNSILSGGKGVLSGSDIRQDKN